LLGKDVMPYAGCEDEQLAGREMVVLSFGAYLQPPLEDLNGDHPIGLVLGQSGALVEEEERERETGMPVERLLSVPVGCRDGLGGKLCRRLLKVDLVLRCPEPFLGMSTQPP